MTTTFRSRTDVRMAPPVAEVASSGRHAARANSPQYVGRASVTRVVAENFLKTSETTQADYAAVRRVDPDSDREAEVFVRLCDELFQGGKNKARNFRPSDELLTWAKGMGFTLPFNKAIRSLIDRSPQADGSDLALVMGIDLHDATSSDSEVTRLYFTVPAQDSAEDLAALDTGTIGVDRLGPVFLAVSGVRDKGELHPSSVHMYDIVPAQQAAA